MSDIEEILKDDVNTKNAGFTFYLGTLGTGSALIVSLLTIFSMYYNLKKTKAELAVMQKNYFSQKDN